MAFTNSPLAKVTLLSPNHSGQRKHEIDTITIHCVVGQCSAKRIGEIFLPESRQASSNYGIGYDGEIGLYVEEKNRSWCSSSSSNDHRAITIEVASDTKEPYAVTDKAYAALIDLVTDICKRNNIKELKWKGDKSLIGQVDKQNMTVHRWFANKSCPGTYLYERHGQIAAEVNSRLGIQAQAPATEATTQFNKGDAVKLKAGVTTYYDGTKMASWVPKSTLYVLDFKDNNRIVISTLKEGAITGTVFATDLVLVESAKKEDKPAEVKPAVNGTPSAGSQDDEKKLWIEEPKEETEEKIPEENTNQPDTNDGSNDNPVETPAGDGATTEVEKEPEYIKTPEEAQNFIMKLLNHIIDFIVRLFKK